MIRVLVAASSTVARAGLEAILARDPSIIVVGSEEGDASGTISDELAEHEPDVLLLERGLAGDDLLHLAAPPPEHGIATPAVVVLTDEPSQLVAMLQHGVRALLPRAAGVAEILAAVSSAAAGLVSVPAEWLPTMLPTTGAISGAATDGFVMDSPALTPRELEVLRLVSEGLANKQIAARLGISDHTVKFHVGSVFAKLRASTRAEAVRVGARHGLIVL